MTNGRKIHVLVAKPGLDGHDVGAKIIARCLIEAGFDVTYTGLHKSPEQIIHQAQELGVDVVGLSLLSGAHLPFCRKLKTIWEQSELGDILWLVGGVIPEEDEVALKELGVDGIFPVGASLDSIADFIRKNVS